MLATSTILTPTCAIRGTNPHKSVVIRKPNALIAHNKLQFASFRAVRQANSTDVSLIKLYHPRLIAH